MGWSSWGLFPDRVASVENPFDSRDGGSPLPLGAQFETRRQRHRP